MSSFILYSLGVLFFVFFLMLSIGLHELGHLYFAKKFNTRATQYFIGFGRTVWSRKRGETEYGLKLLPLGGYVKISGMLPPVNSSGENGDGKERIRESNTGLFTQVIDNTRNAEYEDIPEKDYDRLFYKLPWWKKFIIMGAGPAVNIALAFLIFLGVFATYGNREMVIPDGAPTVGFVADCINPKFAAQVDCESGGAQATPAKAAGLEVGDVVTVVAGTKVDSWEQVKELVNSNKGKATPITVQRDGEPVELSLTPLAIEDRGFIGISVNTELLVTRGGPIYTVKEMGEKTVEVAIAIKGLPPKITNVINALLGKEERDPTGPMSVVGGSRIAGEVASEEPEVASTADKIAFLFLLVAGFNLFIGILNLIPIPPLDGSHMAGALWEGMRRRGAKILGRADPGPVDIGKMMPVAQFFGMSLFILGMILILGDIFVPISIR